MGNLFQYFALTLKFGNFMHNSKISYIFFLSIVSHCFSNHCYLPYNMPRRAPMSSIWRPFDGTGSGAKDNRILIQCANG